MTSISVKSYEPLIFPGFDFEVQYLPLLAMIFLTAMALPKQPVSWGWYGSAKILEFAPLLHSSLPMVGSIHSLDLETQAPNI
jgi:hypothetical protein